jgi:hypothetical protein
MAEVAIWNRIITAAEALEIYNAGLIKGMISVSESTKQDLQLWYRVGETYDAKLKLYDTKSKLYDQSEEERHSSLVSGLEFTNYYDDSKPSYHKIFKNTAYKIVEGSTLSSPTLEKTHNNAFFSTPIPASDYQYSWIDNSLRTEYGIDSGKQNHYRYSPVDGILSSSAGYVEAIIFPSSSNIT